MTKPSNKSILLIEDDPAIQESLAWILKIEGYEVHTANNGQEGLDWLEKGTLPAKIILDLMMPVMSGVKFREIQQADPALKNIPTVIMSAALQEDAGFTLNANEKALKKPVDLDDLLQLLSASYQ
jgi:two-component system alkaline phosphatase synthesis response regulator PhoP